MAISSANCVEHSYLIGLLVLRTVGLCSSGKVHFERFACLQRHTSIITMQPQYYMHSFYWGGCPHLRRTLQRRTAASHHVGTLRTTRPCLVSRRHPRLPRTKKPTNHTQNTHKTHVTHTRS